MTVPQGETHATPDQSIGFQLLGTFRVYVNGQLVDVGARRDQCLLVGLLAAKSQPVQRSRLKKWIWDDPSPGATRDLAKLMTDLRRRLNSVGLADALIAEDGTCALRVPIEAVDAYQFEVLVERARSESDQACRAGLLRQALDMIYGEPLDGLTGEEIDAFRAELAEKNRVAQIAFMQSALHLGQHDHVMGDLARLAKADPLDQQVAGLFMLAQYRNGNMTGAQRTFRNIRAAFRDELGQEPGRDLISLHQSILEQDPTLDLPNHLPRLSGVTMASRGSPDPAFTGLNLSIGKQSMSANKISNDWTGEGSADEPNEEPPSATGPNVAIGDQSMTAGSIFNRWPAN